jgi:N-acetylneuraminate synthase/N,N'-diacetyllegionaminate synthase
MSSTASLFHSKRGGPYVIAEAGVNHDGDVHQAMKLVDIAAAAGADAVKFQLFTPEELVSEQAPLASYQERSGEKNQMAMLKRLTLPQDDYRALKMRAEEQGIDFMATPFDSTSAQYLATLQVRIIKIPSGELTNIPFLQSVAVLGLPAIISTGMANLEEVHAAVQPFVQHDVPFGLLHCVSAYPAPPEQMNLRCMETLRVRFGVPVGFSDHTEGIATTLMAVAAGAEIIEKHFTIDRTLPGPDHAASLEPDELVEMIRRMRDPQDLSTIEVSDLVLGSGEKRCQPCEYDVRDVARRSVLAERSIPHGTVITTDMLEIKRPGTGIAPADLQKIIGRTSACDIPQGAVFQWDMLQQ